MIAVSLTLPYRIALQQKRPLWKPIKNGRHTGMYAQ